MIEPTQAASVATGSATNGVATNARAAAVQSVRSFASELAKSSNAASSTPASTTAPATTKAPARPDGEQTKKVAGHPYSKIVNGDDKGLFLNQVADSPRMGKAFKLLERNDHVFHIYGTGKDRVIIDVAHKSTTDATKTAADQPPTSSAATTPS